MEGRRRTVLPLFMVEEIHDPEGKGDGQQQQQQQQQQQPPPPLLSYVVSDPGPILGAHLVPASHSATVSVLPAMERGGGGGGGGTTTTAAAATAATLVWQVDFEVARYAGPYRALTELTVGVACRTVAEVLAVPRLLTVGTVLPPGGGSWRGRGRGEERKEEKEDDDDGAPPPRQSRP